ncbi:MAG: Undecaprenyl-diphosphatase BcrC [Bacteroidetes bacterium ADurb.Bin408]|nr:MAG: Undecaprenyl-diphosphatase BcrC [Bacteroidetes bacterium ADurb.Bin408]
MKNSLVSTFLFTIFLIIAAINLVQSQNKDIDLLRDINLKRNMRLDGGFKVVTNTVIPVGVGAPVGMFATGLLTKDATLRNNGIEAGGSFILATCLTYGLKWTVRRPRPYDTYPDLQAVVKESSYSFPSGHTSAAFATATSISLMYPKWYVIAPSFTWACLAGYSRMHLGAHYPSDVATGIVIGVGSALLMHQGAKWYQKKYGVN